MEMQDKLYSPVDGKIIPVSQVKDEVFQKQYFGKGITIFPQSDTIISPVDGVIEKIAEDGHSIRILAENHARIWIYIGDDIVNQKGECIDIYVKETDIISVGTPLLECDFDEMRRQNYNLEVTVTVMEQENVFDLIPFKEGLIRKKEELAGILFHESQE